MRSNSYEKLMTLSNNVSNHRFFAANNNNGNTQQRDSTVVLWFTSSISQGTIQRVSNPVIDILQDAICR